MKSSAFLTFVFLGWPPARRIVCRRFRTRQAYGNHYWPTIYSIDKDGRLRYVHIGEGAIQALLAEPYSRQ
jgi:hypothetical protein